MTAGQRNLVLAVAAVVLLAVGILIGRSFRPAGPGAEILPAVAGPGFMASTPENIW